MLTHEERGKFIHWLESHIHDNKLLMEQMQKAQMPRNVIDTLVADFRHKNEAFTVVLAYLQKSEIVQV